MRHPKRRERGPRWLPGLWALGTLAVVVGLGAAPVAAQDLCGCAGDPTALPAFDTNDPSTWPAGTTSSGNPVRIEIPMDAFPDGRMVFEDFRVDNANGVVNTTVVFLPNDQNSPVTLLVSGDLFVGLNDVISVDASGGTAGNSTRAGVGGAGGPGGFRGGDGAYERVNNAQRGGDGQGPGGGAGGTVLPTLDPAGGGAYLGVPELLPLVGASGGGGGYSELVDLNCAGGGGGGGGGAFLAVVNGTIEIRGLISAVGGLGGNRAATACSSSGGGGSGGSIRLVGAEIAGSGAISVASGNGGASPVGLAGDDGRVRLEGFAVTYTGSISPAGALSQVLVPGPVANPLRPTVRITAVDGEAVAQPPQGFRGQTLDIPPRAAPGPVSIDVESQDVPGGTTVEVTLKPQVGGTTTTATGALGACSPTGTCTAAVAMQLDPGAYYVEARATFMTP